MYVHFGLPLRASLSSHQLQKRVDVDIDDDDVYYYISDRLKLEGETELILF